MHDAGLDARILDDGGFRSYADQDRLYARGRTAPGPKVTNARGGQSNHNFTLAYDASQFDGHGHYIGSGSDPAYARAGKLGEAAGLEWGGDWQRFKDRPHYQFTRNAPLDQLRARHDQGLDPLPQRD